MVGIRWKCRKLPSADLGSTKQKKISEKCLFFFTHVPVDGENRAVVGERVDIGADHGSAGDVYYFLPRLRDTAGRFMGTRSTTDPANPAETIIINKIANTVIVNIGPSDVLPVSTIYRPTRDVYVCFEY